MALVAVVSVKNGPGGSTALLALAATWRSYGAPGRGKPIVVEADPQGGDWMLRFGALAEPGLATLATAARRGDLSTRLLREHAQVLPGGVAAVLAPDRPDKCQAALEALAPVWEKADLGDAVVLVDCGRLGRDSALVEGVLRAADVVVVVCRGSADSLGHAATAADRLRPVAKGLVLAVVGDSVWSLEEIRHALRVDVCCALPHDERCARVLHGSRYVRRFGRRAPRWALFEGAGALVKELEAFVPQPETVTVAAPRQVQVPAQSNVGLAHNLKTGGDT